VSLRSLLRLLTVAVTLLLGCTACLEHVEALRTRVEYDPFAQVYHVRRTLIGVEADFLGCSDAEECVAAIGRTLSLQPADSLSSFALSDRLLDRLMGSGATDVRLTLHREGDRLDVIVDYDAPVGSSAADDTLVHTEWRGGKGRGHYYLVVDAQDNMDPPKLYRSRKVARSSSEGIDWVEQWVLPRWRRSVETLLPVGESTPLFQRFPDLVAALEDKGWLDHPEELGAPTEQGPRVAQLLRGSDEPPAPAPAAKPVAAEGTPAKAWFYDARVSGGGVTVASAAVAIDPLKSGIGDCYADRIRQVPGLEGSVFLSALVRPDGSVIGTAVNSSIPDPPLMSCLEHAIGDLRFAAWGKTGDGVSDVVIPVVLRVEKPGRR
jgi:hypothetical protein